MKKVSAFLVAAILMSGCAPSGRDAKTKLVLAVPASEERRPMLLSLTEEFESKHPDVSVQLLEIPGNYYQKLLVMIAGRTPPDVMWMGQSFAEFAVKDVFMDITDRLRKDPDIDLSEYPEQVLGWYKLGGKQLGVPYGVDVGFIAFNKGLFKKRGVPFPRSDWDLKEFLETAKKMTFDEDGDGKTDVYGYSGHIYYAAFGADLLTPDKRKAACDSPEMLAAIHFNLDLVYKWKVSPPPDNQLSQSAEKFTVFHQGKVAMMNFETYNLPYLREQCADIDWDIVLMPKAKRRGYWASSNAYLISKDTKHPDEAWSLLKEFLSDRFQTVMSSSTVPANMRIAKRALEGNTRPPEHLKDLLNAVGHLYPFPRVANLQELRHAYWLDLSKVYTFYEKPDMRVSPEVAMERAAARINRILRRNKERGR